MGGSTAPVSTPNSNAPSGTSIVVLFHKPLSGTKVAEIKKALAPVLDFEKRSATEIYAENLAPEVKKAIQDKKVLEGMDREVSAMYIGTAVQGWCFELDASGARIALTNTTADAMRSVKGMDVTFK